MFSDISDKIQMKVGTKISEKLSLLLYMSVQLIFFKAGMYYFISLTGVSKSEEPKQLIILFTIIAHNAFAAGKITSFDTFLLRPWS